jgi:carboxyl-terminal processing protease
MRVQESGMSLKTRIFLVLFVGTVMGLGLSFGGAIVAQRPPSLPQNLSWEQAQQLAEVMERVRRDFIEPVDEQRAWALWQK